MAIMIAMVSFLPSSALSPSPSCKLPKRTLPQPTLDLSQALQCCPVQYCSGNVNFSPTKKRATANNTPTTSSAATLLMIPAHDKGQLLDSELMPAGNMTARCSIQRERDCRTVAFWSERALQMLLGCACTFGDATVIETICTGCCTAGRELTSQGGIDACEISAQHAGEVPPKDRVAAVCALAGGCCSRGRRFVLHRPHSSLDALDGLRKLLQLDHNLHQKRRGLTHHNTEATAVAAHAKVC